MAARPALLPPKTTPAELATHLGVSERALRERAYAIGAYHKIGQTMFFTDEDVNQLMEDAKPCPSKSSAGGASGTTRAPSPAGDFAALRERLTKPSRKGSRRKSKGPSGAVISMDRGLS